MIICHALVCRYCWCLGIASRAQLLKESAWLIHLTGGKVHLLHAIVVRLHVHKANVVILTPESAGTVGV